MDRDTSYRLLRIAYSLLYNVVTKPDKDTALSIGRDIYDIVEEKTIDGDLRYQMQECRASGWTRTDSLRYLNHRLNIGFF